MELPQTKKYKVLDQHGVKSIVDSHGHPVKLSSLDKMVLIEILTTLGVES